MASNALVTLALAMLLAGGGDPARDGGGGAQKLTASEERGRHIYRNGSAADGTEITALLGEAGTRVPARVLTCAGCHGLDGAGRPEGGVSPTDLRWSSLSKPYGGERPGGRKHPPYDAKSLRRAITHGVDPAGQRLDPAMPRYEMRAEDARDLVAYVSRLGTLRDPGITEDAVRLGCALPAGSAGPYLATLRAYFDEVNAAGGVHGRRLVLEAREYGEEGGLAAVSELVESGVFALSTCDTSGIESEVGALLADRGAPLVGALTQHPAAGFPPNRETFYLLGGLRTQALALVEHALAADGGPPRSFAVVLAGGDGEERLAREVLERLEAVPGVASSVARPDSQDEVARLVAELAGRRCEAVLLLLADELQERFLDAARRAGWAAKVHVPGPLAAPGLAEAVPWFPGEIRLSLPRAVTDQTRGASDEFLAFCRRHGMADPGRLAERLTAWCSARLLVEGLRRAGRDLGREKLIEALEGLYLFETGLFPPLTYGPNRRVGAGGAHVVSLGGAPGDRPTTVWQELR